MKIVEKYKALNIMSMHYSKPIQARQVMMKILMTTAYLSVMLYSTFFYNWLFPLAFMGGVVYTLKKLIPNQIESKYKHAAMHERNRLMNNLSQNLYRKGATLLDSLMDVCNHRIQGELRKDVQILISKIDGADEEERRQAYECLIVKYEHDRIFVQFVEHLLTLDLHGKDNLTALDETTDDHNLLLKWIDDLESEKKFKFKFFCLNSGLAFICTIFTIGLTWSTYIESFAHMPVGWFFGGVYLTIIFYFNHRFVKDYYDYGIEA